MMPRGEKDPQLVHPPTRPAGSPGPRRAGVQVNRGRRGHCGDTRSLVPEEAGGGRVGLRPGPCAGGCGPRSGD